jgi:hypothetical protein
MFARLALAAVAPVALLSAAGCGGGSGSSNPVSAAPADSLLFVEGTIRPTGELKENADAIAERLTGHEGLGDFIASELEGRAREEGETFDFEREVSPWLGARAGAYFRRYDGEDFSRGAVILQSTDDAAAQRFIAREAKRGDDPASGASYKGVDFEVDGDSAVGLVGDLVVAAEDEASFKDAVDAAGGASLSGEKRFERAIAGATEGSLADVFVDVGAMLEESEGSIDPEARRILRGAGIDPGEATVVASLIPRGDVVELDLSSDLAGEEAPGGDASELLGRLPAGSVAAIGVPGFGKQLEAAIDSLDRSGIPGEVPPGELISGLKAAGIDPGRIAANLGDGGVFVEGESERSLGGALVVDTEDPQRARDTVTSIGLFLRRADTPGVTALKGAASGFSIRDREELGERPLAIVAKGGRIAIGYGIAPALRGLDGGAPLSGNPAYREAVAALGEIPISAFVDGPAALRLASSLVPRSDEDFRDAEPYLRKISSVAIGSVSDGDLATATLIVSIENGR